jgi:predicted transcriptional regulator
LKALWPYILPLPIKKRELDRVFQAVFRSKAALSILKKASPNKRIYQRELISKLDYSNKTIIKSLKKLVSAGLLEQGMEKREEKGRTVWIKWYTPTFQGKWFVLLFQPQTRISQDQAQEIITELFKMYMENIIKLCTDYDIETTVFESTMNKTLIKMSKKGK